MSATTNTGGSDWVQRVYNANNHEELTALYNDWAKEYDSDIAAQDYVAPALTVQAAVAANARVDGRILDAGCGTGLCGVAWKEAGAQDIDGIDLSPGMLSVAAQAGVYRDLAVADLTKTLDKPDGQYDAVTCVGTLTHGHVGPRPALREFVRVLKPGGVLAATVVVAIWKSHGYEEEVAEMERQELVDIISTNDADYRIAAGAKAKIVVLRKI